MARRLLAFARTLTIVVLMMSGFSPAKRCCAVARTTVESDGDDVIIQPGDVIVDDDGGGGETLKFDDDGVEGGGGGGSEGGDAGRLPNVIKYRRWILHLMASAYFSRATVATQKQPRFGDDDQPRTGDRQPRYGDRWKLRSRANLPTWKRGRGKNV